MLAISVQYTKLAGSLRIRRLQEGHGMNIYR
jgi:hypothetical protein